MFVGTRAGQYVEQIEGYKAFISCYASKLNAETGSPARPTRIVENLTVKLDAQQLT